MSPLFPFHEYLLIPGWWQKAYRETALLSDSKDIKLMGAAAKLMPALKVDELEGVSFALGQIQRKWLSSEKQQAVHFDFHQHLKDCSHKQKKHSYQRSQQLLPFLSVAHNGQDYQRLFQFEGWTNTDNSHQAVLDLDDEQVSILFGIQGASTLLINSMNKKKYVNALEHNHSLTMINIPIWLELKAVEKQLLLWILHQSKNFENWAGLDGEIAMDLNLLSQEVSFPRPRGDRGLSPFENMMKYLSRFLPKLHAHGWLTVLGEESKYFNITSLTNTPAFVWQMSTHAQQMMFSATEKVSNQLFQAKLNRQGLQGDLQLFGLEQDKRFLRFSQVIKDVLNTKESTPSWTLSSEHLPNIYYDISTILLELVARSDASHPLKLPDWVSYHDAVRELTSGIEGMSDCVKKFTENFPVEKDFFKKYVHEESLAVIAKNRPEDFKVFCELKKKSPRKVQLGLRSQVQKSQSETPDVAMSAKLATTTINEMMKNDKKSYQELKMRYYDSLSEVDRGLILEIQSRMQPHLFQAQIKQRLVKFLMLDPNIILAGARDLPAGTELHP